MHRKLFNCFTQHPSVVGLAGFVAVFFAIGAFVLYQQGQNREAIRTTCVLVSNLSVQGLSGNDASDIVRKESLKNASPATLERYKEARARQQPFQTPDCERIANDPDSVKAAPERVIQRVPDKNNKR